MVRCVGDTDCDLHRESHAHEDSKGSESPMVKKRFPCVEPRVPHGVSLWTIALESAPGAPWDMRWEMPGCRSPAFELSAVCGEAQQEL